MRAFAVKVIFFSSVCVFSLPLCAQSRSSISSMIKAGRYEGALARLSSSRSLNNFSHMNLRADILNRLGYYHASLYERVRAARKKATYRALKEIGAHSLVLGRYRPSALVLSRVGDSLKRRLPTEYRVALAGYNLTRGRLERARQWLPSVRRILSLPMGPVRFQSILLASSIYMGSGSMRNAMALMGSEFREAPQVDLGRFRLERARLLFEMGRFGPVLEELRFLPRSSPSWYEGQMVGAWSAYHLGDYNLSLGYLMNLHSPFLAKKYNPESYLLSAAVLYQLCYYPSAQRSLNQLKNLYGPVLKDISRARRIVGQPIRFMGLLGGYLKGDTFAPDSILQRNWNLMMDGIAQKQRIAGIDQGLLQLEKEQKLINEVFSYGSLRNLKAHYLKAFKQARSEYYQSASNFALSTLNFMQSDLKKHFDSLEIVELEINTQLRDRLLKRQAAGRRRVDYRTEVEKGFEFWPFEGEFWRDETGGYAFVTAGACGT